LMRPSSSPSDVKTSMPGVRLIGSFSAITPE
jgi:hypothetical protein